MKQDVPVDIYWLLFLMVIGVEPLRGSFYSWLFFFPRFYPGLFRVQAFQAWNKLPKSDLDK